MAKKVGKHAKMAATIAPASFLLPSVAVGACIVGVVSNYEPLVFDASQFPAPQQAQAAQLSTIDTSEVERASAEPATDVEYSAADYGIDADNLKDGTYTGSGQGFKSTITVQVVISGGKITSINVLSQADDAEYFARARGVITSVLSRQSTSVDTVSGATYSSKGILMAIRNALIQAAGGTPQATQEATAPSQAQRPQASLAPIASLGDAYADGTYLGTGVGFNGDVTIAITMQSGKLTSVVVVSTDDDEEYFSRAEALLSAVMEKQSTAVDTVSGATYSSKGILAAIEDALAKSKAAKENGTAGTDAPGTDTPEPSPNPDDSGNPGSKPGDSDANTPDRQVKYLDGEFTAYVLCENEKRPEAFEPYYLALAVVVKDGEIAEVKDVHGSATGEKEDAQLGEYDEENDEYIERAMEGYTRRGVFYKGVLAQLLEDKMKPADVQVVSSATYSSKAFVSAYQKALEASAAAYEKEHPSESGDSAGDSGVAEDGSSAGSSRGDASGETPGQTEVGNAANAAKRGASHA